MLEKIISKLYTIPVDRFQYMRGDSYSKKSIRYYKEEDYTFFLIEKCRESGGDAHSEKKYTRSLIVKDNNLKLEKTCYYDENTINAFFELHQTIFSYIAKETYYSVFLHHPKWNGESYEGKTYNPSVSDRLLTNLFERIARENHEIWQQKNKYEEEQKRLQTQVNQQQVQTAKEAFERSLK